MCLWAKSTWVKKLAAWSRNIPNPAWSTAEQKNQGQDHSLPQHIWIWLPPLHIWIRTRLIHVPCPRKIGQGQASHPPPPNMTGSGLCRTSPAYQIESTVHVQSPDKPGTTHLAHGLKRLGTSEIELEKGNHYRQSPIFIIEGTNKSFYDYDSKYAVVHHC